jgi:hypothetical protein
MWIYDYCIAIISSWWQFTIKLISHFSSDLALSALAPDSFAKLANRTKYINSLIQENYISKVGDKPWVAFDMGATRKVIFLNNIQSLQISGKRRMARQIKRKTEL